MCGFFPPFSLVKTGGMKNCLCEFFKKRSGVEELANYRPGSLILALEKLVESDTKMRTAKHMEERALLRKKQHGFCKEKILPYQLLGVL